MKNSLNLLFVVILSTNNILAQSSPCSAEQLYQQTTCALGDATFNEVYLDMYSTTTINPSCTSDDETARSVLWVKFTASDATATLTNMIKYVGGGAANVGARDFVVYSGSCATITSSTTPFACFPQVAQDGGTASLTGLTVGSTYIVQVSMSSLTTNTTADLASICLTSTTPVTQPAATCDACTAPCSLTTNVTRPSNGFSATADSYICSGSVENNVWFQWCCPSSTSTWPSGQKAYVSVFDQICNSSAGLQMTVWNTGTACPTAASSPNLLCENPGITTSYYYEWIPTNGTCYNIVLDGYAGTQCSFNITVGSIIVLPVEMEEFEVSVNADKSVGITFSNNFNKEISLLTIEKSIDGKEWLELDRFLAPKSREVYKSIDANPAIGINYYRLKMQDNNATISYSEIKLVDLEQDITFYHDNQTENIIIKTNNPELLIKQVSVSNLNGKQLIHKEVNDNSYECSSSEYHTGLYFVHVTTSNNKNFIYKIIK